MSTTPPSFSSCCFWNPRYGPVLPIYMLLLARHRCQYSHITQSQWHLIHYLYSPLSHQRVERIVSYCCWGATFTYASALTSIFDSRMSYISLLLLFGLFLSDALLMTRMPLFSLIILPAGLPTSHSELLLPGGTCYLSNVVLCGYSMWLLYQDGKEKDNSLCSFVPGGDAAVPCWEIWALACWISAESGGKMLWGWGWKGCRKWWEANMPVVSVGL